MAQLLLSKIQFTSILEILLVLCILIPASAFAAGNNSDAIIDNSYSERDFAQWEILYLDYTSGFAVYASLFIAAVFGAFSLLGIIKKVKKDTIAYALGVIYFLIAIMTSYVAG